MKLAGSTALVTGANRGLGRHLAEQLIARGVPAERLRARGFAARRPIADNTTESGRARNRRIEFHVVTAE